jgi:hypothetical protein
MKIMLNELKKWKKSKKSYDRKCINLCKNNKWTKSEIFLKMFNIKSPKECKKIIKDNFEEIEIKERSLASYLFDIWEIVGTKEDDEKEYLDWNKYRNPSIRKLKTIMNKNNYKEIELKAGGFYYFPKQTIIKIEK